MAVCRLGTGCVMNGNHNVRSGLGRLVAGIESSLAKTKTDRCVAFGDNPSENYGLLPIYLGT